MKKKILFIVILVIVVIIGVEIYVSKNNHSKINEMEQKVSENVEDTNEIEQNDLAQNESAENNVISNEVSENTNSNFTQNTSSNTGAGISSNSYGKDDNTIKQVSPRGFMGSSSYRVNLQSNGEVYVIAYNGEGFEDKNIVSKKLVAKNVKTIEESYETEDEGGVIVKGGEVIDNNFGWIIFENEGN